MKKILLILFAILVSAGVLIGSTKQVINTPNAETVTDTGHNKISIGSRSLIVVKDDGTVYGLVATEGDAMPTMQLIEGLNNIVEVAAGNGINIALDAEGYVWRFVPLKDGGFSEPIRIDGLDNIESIHLNYIEAFALKSDGTVWIFGFIYNYDFLWPLFGSDYSKLPPMNAQYIDITDQLEYDYYDFMLSYWGTHYVIDRDIMLGITPWQIPQLHNITKITGDSIFIDSDGTILSLEMDGIEEMIGIEDVSEILGYYYILKEDQTVWELSWEGDNQYSASKIIPELNNTMSLKGGTTPITLDYAGNIWCAEEKLSIADPSKISKDSLVIEFKFAENETWYKNYLFDNTSIIYTNVLLMDANIWRIAVIKNDGSLWYLGKSYVGLSDDDIHNVDVPLLDYERGSNQNMIDYLKIQVQPKQIYNENGTPFNFFD